MHAAQFSVNLSPGPILDAVDGFTGTIFDLDQSLTVDADGLARARVFLEAQMDALGLRRGDRVIVTVGNGPLFVATLVAVLARGGDPLLVHFKTPASELKRTALRFGARFIACDGLSTKDLSEHSDRANLIGDDSWVQLVWATVDDADTAFQGDFPSLGGVPLHPTSGTTGLPKVAVRPGASAVAEAEHYIETADINEHDVILAVPPMSHAYAYGMCVMVPLLSGASVVTMREFSRPAVFRSFAEQGITIFPAVPAMLEVLMFGAGEDLPHIPRCVFSAGAPLPSRLAHTFQQKTGRTVRPLYGTTETGGISIAVNEEEALTTGGVGSPMNGVEVAVQTPPADWTGPQGVGPLSIRSSSMMAGYLSPEGIDSSMINDGWFNTGDLANVDSTGAIVLKGRDSEVVNVGGLKVVPSEVEEVLAGLPAIVETKVYAGNTRSGTQFVKAAIVSDGSLDLAQVRSHCEEHLVYYKRPSTILFVDALPKTPSGKVILKSLP